MLQHLSAGEDPESCLTPSPRIPDKKEPRLPSVTYEHSTFLPFSVSLPTLMLVLPGLPAKSITCTKSLLAGMLVGESA